MCSEYIHIYILYFRNISGSHLKLEALFELELKVKTTSTSKWLKEVWSGTSCSSQEYTSSLMILGVIEVEIHIAVKVDILLSLTKQKSMDILLPYLSRQWQINLYLVKISFHNPYICCFAKYLSHKILIFSFIDLFSLMLHIVYVCICHMCLYLQSPEEDTWYPGSKVIGYYEQLGMGTGNSGPQAEWQMLLTAKASLQPPSPRVQLVVPRSHISLIGTLQFDFSSLYVVFRDKSLTYFYKIDLVL